jgi:hypothetical protein
VDVIEVNLFVCSHEKQNGRSADHSYGFYPGAWLRRSRDIRYTKRQFLETTQRTNIHVAIQRALSHILFRIIEHVSLLPMGFTDLPPSTNSQGVHGDDCAGVWTKRVDRIQDA